MRAREYLLQVRKLDKLIENKMAEVEKWKTMAMGVSSISSSADRVQTSHNPDKMINAIHKYVEIEEELNADIDKYVDLKKEVVKTIEKLDAYDYDILHKLYIQNKTMDEVATYYDKSYSWVASIQGRALQRLQEVLNVESCKEI